MAETLKSWPAGERPREKLFQHGPASLTDAELLAVLLRSGFRQTGVMTQARDLIAAFGGLRGLFSQEGKRLGEIKGLGPAKAATLLAVTEISKRCLKQQMIGKSFIREPQAVVDYLTADFQDQKKEAFKILFLNKAHAVIEARTLFTGTVDRAMVHPREIIRAALEFHASALVLAHNHPSGQIEPSAEDREITAKLASLCEAMSMKVLDHIIIGGNRYFSFRENGLL
ncbi:MAG TPA: DNA repair protein RadC [Verrucomicrobiae bacterium]|jgi:DNA repair protein RadC|nr:DNA repair protein RadC [Verrucomicrobiae bacterium]